MVLKSPYPGTFGESSEGGSTNPETADLKDTVAPISEKDIPLEIKNRMESNGWRLDNYSHEDDRASLELMYLAFEFDQEKQDEVDDAYPGVDDGKNSTARRSLIEGYKHFIKGDRGFKAIWATEVLLAKEFKSAIGKYLTANEDLTQLVDYESKDFPDVTIESAGEKIKAYNVICLILRANKYLQSEKMLLLQDRRTIEN